MGSCYVVQCGSRGGRSRDGSRCSLRRRRRAHHSYSATYDVSQRSRSRASWFSSSSRTRIPSSRPGPRRQAPSAAGRSNGPAPRSWRVRCQSATRSSRATSVIVGNPSRATGEFKALMVSLKRPSTDSRGAAGARWSTDASPLVALAVMRACCWRRRTRRAQARRPWRPAAHAAVAAPSTSPATGCRSSSRTGSGGW